MGGTAERTAAHRLGHGLGRTAAANAIRAPLSVGLAGTTAARRGVRGARSHDSGDSRSGPSFGRSGIMLLLAFRAQNRARNASGELGIAETRPSYRWKELLSFVLGPVMPWLWRWSSFTSCGRPRYTASCPPSSPPRLSCPIP